MMMGARNRTPTDPSDARVFSVRGMVVRAMTRGRSERRRGEKV